MVPRQLIDTAPIPGGGELRLYRRGDEFSIMLGGNELMNSRISGSEEALATLACARIAGRPLPRLLIGGLGMGFTLRAALAALPKDAKVTVAELVPAVIGWAKAPMAHLYGGSIEDQRVTLIAADVVELLGAAGAEYDAILLDVDNGPDGLTRAENDRLYSSSGLSRARFALREGGVLALWSAAPDKAFTERLRRARFAVEETAVRAHRGRGARHVIWIAAKAG